MLPSGLSVLIESNMTMNATFHAGVEVLVKSKRSSNAVVLSSYLLILPFCVVVCDASSTITAALYLALVGLAVLLLRIDLVFIVFPLDWYVVLQIR